MDQEQQEGTEGDPGAQTKVQLGQAIAFELKNTFDTFLASDLMPKVSDVDQVGWTGAGLLLVCCIACCSCACVCMHVCAVMLCWVHVDTCF